MSHMLDRAARILAKPSSRRDSLKLIGGMFSSSVLGALWAGRLNAQGEDVQRNAARCGNQTCNRDQRCCTTGSRPFCLTLGKTCCGNVGCDSNKICCPNGARSFCATKGEVCCGSTAANSNQICCRTGTAPFVATKGRHCCGNTSCGPNDRCCTDATRPFCATNGRTCCGRTGCGPGQKCCDNTVCCNEHQECVGGRCSASNT